MPTPDKTLKHRTRKIIYNYISAHPGISFSDIKNVLDLTDSTLRYHLDLLEKGEKIKSMFVDGKKSYYPVQRVIFEPLEDISRVKMHRLNRSQELIVDTISREPGITQKELIRRTRLKRITVSYNIRKLLDWGMIKKESRGRNIRYHCITDEQLHEEILKGLVVKLLKNEIDENTFLMLKRKLEIYSE